MALARADRGPLVEVLDRTPPIPEACQWATFLRNHDELTLEMVSEEERQFMWEFYAPEPRMRLNLGIRRRLAPLLGNDRDRIELANSLLFSLPGSPVVYYGDEIGMGDNIWLEDRDGVRTPMQWDSTATAGFSEADREEFYAPLLDDPAYVPSKVNVADQMADPGSLLNTTRHMIQVRKEQAAFGRGSFTWVDADNAAVAAYLRSHCDENVLLVANLSAEPQSVCLTHPSLESTTARDLIAGAEMPSMQGGMATLELPRYGYLWLKL
jgi:maltose alpha-D-glucosyltransferase/alpha-amylase